MNASMIGRGASPLWRLLGIVAVAAFLVSWLAMSASSDAADVSITNCTGQQVKICSADSKSDDVNSNKIDWDQKKTLDDQATGKFKCEHHCAFDIVQCQSGDCDECKKGDWLDHMWGGGSYVLVSLTQYSSGNYPSSDLQKGTSCPQ
jgi:hypothetical protein